MKSRVKQSSVRSELLARMRASPSRIEGGQWAVVWRDLIARRASDAEAESFFQEIQDVAHPAGSRAFLTRASEGRRVFAYGKIDPSHAVHLLRTLPYLKAIRAMPVRTMRGARSDPKKALRDRISGLMEDWIYRPLRVS